MSEYKHTVHKTGLQGITQDPPQRETNAGSPGFLDKGFTIRNGLVLGVSVSTAKQVFGAGFKAIVSETGNSKLENSVGAIMQGAQYAVMGSISLPLLAINIAGDVATYTISTMVNRHRQSLDNELISFERGTRRKFGVSNYYG